RRMEPVRATEGEGLTRLEDLPRGRALHRQYYGLLQESLADREIQGIHPQLVVRAVRQRHAHRITVHHPPQGRRDHAEEVPELEVRHDAVGDLEQQGQTLIVALQRGVRVLRSLEIQRVINGQRELVRHE